MLTTDIKPLHPLSHGNILLVGIKTGNLDDEIRTHPRVIIWDSQQEHWTNKDFPLNTQAVFTTRFIGHAAFGKILREARKKQITIFNPEGTGMINKQVRELLDIVKKTEETTVTTTPESKTRITGGRLAPKLHVLQPFIDFSKNNSQNATALLQKAGELGVVTTFGSLAQFVSVQRRKTEGRTAIPRPGRRNMISPSMTPTAAHKQVDVVVEILDSAIRELKDVREYLISTIAENEKLRAKVAKFRKFFEE